MSTDPTGGRKVPLRDQREALVRYLELTRQAVEQLGREGLVEDHVELLRQVDAIGLTLAFLSRPDVEIIRRAVNDKTDRRA